MNQDVLQETIRVGPLYRQPPQQAGTAQRVRAQGSRPALGRRQDCGMPPPPHLPQHPRPPIHNSRKAGVRLLVRRRA